MFTSTSFASILPEILVLLIGILVLVVEPFWKEEQRAGSASWVEAKPEDDKAAKKWR